MPDFVVLSQVFWSVFQQSTTDDQQQLTILRRSGLYIMDLRGLRYVLLDFADISQNPVYRNIRFSTSGWCDLQLPFYWFPKSSRPTSSFKRRLCYGMVSLQQSKKKHHFEKYYGMEKKHICKYLKKVDLEKYWKTQHRNNSCEAALSVEEQPEISGKKLC